MNKKGTINRDRIIAGGSILLFAGAFTFGVIQNDRNNEINAQLDEHRATHAKLQEQSAGSQKSLLAANSRAQALAQENHELQASLMKQQADLKQALRKAELAQTPTHKPDHSKKEVEGLKAELIRIEQQLALANSKIKDLASENSRMRGTNEQLTAELAKAGELNTTVNNSLVIATKGKKKEKLTVKARRTDQLHVDLDLPEAFAKQVRTKITGPNGKVYESNEPTITATNAVNGGDATASAGGGVGIQRRMSRVSMKVDPKEKLLPGTYRIDVYSGSKYLGTTRTTLR